MEEYLPLVSCHLYMSLLVIYTHFKLFGDRPSFLHMLVIEGSLPLETIDHVTIFIVTMQVGS